MSEPLTLGLLFGLFYFVQGVCEPTDGLITQPVASLLRRSGASPGEITRFAALLGLPWTIKPIYGLLSDLVPLLGYRRKSYLLLTSLCSCASLLLARTQVHAAQGTLLALLLVPTVGVAFSDVVIDALMVERGQPLGLTGRLQAIQWSSIYGAAMLTGVLGGWLSEHGRQQDALLICGGLSGLTAGVALLLVREPRCCGPRKAVGPALAEIWRAGRSPELLVVSGFVFLWNFNPFSSALLYTHMTGALGLSEGLYGTTVSVVAAGSVLASVAYGLYCRRVALRTLIHGCVVTGILATLAYWGLRDPGSALAISLGVGVTYMTANLITLDLAARACPRAQAATFFSLLMAVMNISSSLSTWVGGLLYEGLGAPLGPRPAFQLLVALGAACTACCWVLVPRLLRLERVLQAGPPGPGAP